MTVVYCVVSAILMGYIMYECIMQHRLIQTLKEQLEQLEHNMKRVIQDHPMLVNADLIFSRQLKDINDQLVSMDNQIQSLENKRDNDGGYQHALRILEMGGDKAEIIKSCHLSSAEADLLINLHAYRKTIKVS